MKKMLLYLLIVFCLSGCGKKLTCTYEENYEDIKIKNKIVFNFKNNTYKEIDKMIFIDVESAKEYFNDIGEYIEVYNLKLTENTIVSELEGSIDTKKTKQEVKKQYEGYEYSCK